MHLQVTGSEEVKLPPHFPRRSFSTIGVGRWVDDEVMNYFIQKWCSKSQTTLGLNTWFACKFLFQEDLCIHAKTILTLEDETGVKRWCRAAEVSCRIRIVEFSLILKQRAQGRQKWERVFIPINERNIHWYSACINFASKRIDIYDSLREVCLENRQKPLISRKNTSTMLVCGHVRRFSPMGTDFHRC